MTPTPIRISLDSAGSHYQPGERLTGRFMVEGTQMRTVRAAELSVLWYTAGKGEEDMAVHHFERLVDDPGRPLDLRVPHRFATVLPTSPLSYDGHIVKVCWCVRVRLFLPQVQESVAEIPFRLGNVAAAGIGTGDLGLGNGAEEATPTARLNLLQPIAPNPQPPSRHSNPFATCWTRPGALEFRFAEGENAAQLVAKLAAQNWWGAVIGPHGCGKSTLMETLKPAFAGGGRRVQAIALHDGQHYLPSNFWEYLAPNPPRDLWEASPTPIESSERLPSSASERPPTAVAIVDGYEQLGWFEQLRLARKCRRANVGLVVTAHRQTRIPTLVRLAPDRDLVVRLVADLCAEVSTSVTKKDVAASLDCHGSNVREIFFDLYDRHEHRRRQAVRT